MEVACISQTLGAQGAQGAPGFFGFLQLPGTGICFPTLAFRSGCSIHAAFGKTFDLSSTAPMKVNMPVTLPEFGYVCGQWGGSPMPVPWSVWDIEIHLSLSLLGFSIRLRMLEASFFSTEDSLNHVIRSLDVEGTGLLEPWNYQPLAARVEELANTKGSSHDVTVGCCCVFSVFLSDVLPARVGSHPRIRPPPVANVLTRTQTFRQPRPPPPFRWLCRWFGGGVARHLSMWGPSRARFAQRVS